MAATTLSRADWAKIEARWQNGAYLLGKFLIDGHKVTAYRQVAKQDSVIQIFVKGILETAWFITDAKPDFVPKLFPERQKGIHVWHDIFFKSAAEMRRTWEANNTSIQLLSKF